jgi:hypothetical protein
LMRKATGKETKKCCDGESWRCAFATDEDENGREMRES